MKLCRAGLLIAITLGALAPIADAAPEPGTELTVDDLSWPATTLSAKTRSSTKVYDTAKRGEYLGTVGKGRRLGWTRIVATRDRCKAWLEIEQGGWVCAKDVKPSDEAPHLIVADAVDAPSTTSFADIRGAGADAFDSAAEIAAGVPARVVPGETFVAVKPKTVRVGGVKYHKTDQGYIASDKLRWLSPSDFTGLDLTTTAPPAWPFGWVTPRKKGQTVWVRATGSRKGAKVRELDRRELVPVLESKKGFARIGTDEWVDAKELRIARTVAPPDGVGAGDRWIDVDLDQQVLVAYQGEVPVFATLVSSGKIKHDTPTGIHRITKKYAKTRMRNPVTSRETWDVAEVPFAMKFRKNFALHGAYWHDGFGKPRSHGCVNLSPRDARVIYDWTQPVVPEGWMSAEVEEETGTVIRIRNRRNPSPKWKDFAGKPIKTGRRVARQ